MLTLLIAAGLGIIIGYGTWYLVGSVLLSIIILVLVIVGVNLLVGRYFLKKITALMGAVEKDLRAERIEPALEKLKSAYRYAPWQFFMKKQLDSQVGSVLYVRKRFDEALPYLKNSFGKNWSALCMLAAYYWRAKDYAAAFKVMDKAVAGNKKEPFVYSLYAYFLTERKQMDQAIAVLTKGKQKIPLNERIANELDAVKNNKKIKIQTYGALWMQLHLGKAQDGAKSYQTFLAGQKISRR